MRKIWSSSTILRIVERARRLQVGAERLLDDDAAELVVALLGEAGLAEPLHDRAEELGRRREIEDGVLMGSVLQKLVELVTKVDEHALVGYVAAQVMDSLAQPRQRDVLDLVAAGFSARGLDDLGHRLEEVGAERLLVGIAAVDAEDGEILVEQALVDEVVDRRHQEALGEIAGGAEDHEEAGRRHRRPLGLVRLEWHLVHRGLAGAASGLFGRVVVQLQVSAELKPHRGE